MKAPMLHLDEKIKEFKGFTSYGTEYLYYE